MFGLASDTVRFCHSRYINIGYIVLTCNKTRFYLPRNKNRYIVVETQAMAVAVYFFSRDLRLFDNTGLVSLAKQRSKILPVFVLTPEQLNKKSNPYYSENCVQFMYECLVDLESSLKSLQRSLTVFSGTHVDSLKALRKTNQIHEVHMMDDITPYSLNRASRIRKWCVQNNVTFCLHEDVDLLNMNQGLRGPNQPYQVFSPFFKHVNQAYTVRLVDTFKLRSDHFVSTRPSSKLFSTLDTLKNSFMPNNTLAVRGGRKEALKRLKLVDMLREYGVKRDFPGLEKSTTLLSASIKFGCVSIREVYWKAVQRFGKTHDFVRELWFRSFYYHIVKYNPHMLQGRPFKLTYESIKWRHDEDAFYRWCKGQTGIPLCDAGMRNLRATGHLHNRVRMVVASVLSKLLLIDWRRGEQVMATFLVDFDPVSNNCGWQTMASTAPPFCEQYDRTMNPFRQSQRYDANAVYIRRWIPELRGVPAKAIHNWEVAYKDYDVDYPAPIVDVKKARQRAKDVFKKALNK